MQNNILRLDPQNYTSYFGGYAETPNTLGLYGCRIVCSSMSSYLGGFSSISALISVDGVEKVSAHIFPGLHPVQNSVKKDQLIEYNIMPKQMTISASMIIQIEMA